MAVKHSAPLAPRPIGDEAADLVHRALADGLIVTGPATGVAAEMNALRAVKAASAGRPVFVGSGVTLETVRAVAPLADGMIVGSWLKVDGDVAKPVDRQRVRQLVAALA